MNSSARSGRHVDAGHDRPAAKSALSRNEIDRDRGSRIDDDCGAVGRSQPIHRHGSGQPVDPNASGCSKPTTIGKSPAVSSRAAGGVPAGVSHSRLIHAISRAAAGRFTLATRHSGQTGAAGSHAANCRLFQRCAGKSRTRPGKGTAPAAVS